MEKSSRISAISLPIWILSNDMLSPLTSDSEWLDLSRSTIVVRTRQKAKVVMILKEKSPDLFWGLLLLAAKVMNRILGHVKVKFELLWSKS